MVAVIALLSAAAYALAMVLQQHGARSAVPGASLHPRLLTRLARDPVWLVGAGANVAGAGLRFAALSRGSFVVVQSLLVASVLLALPASAAWHHERLRSTDLIAAGVAVGGLALFLVAAGPAEGRSDAAGTSWLLLATAIASSATCLVWFARGRDAGQRAALLAAAGGALLALTAAFVKTTAAVLGHRHLGVVFAWQPWALLVSGGLAVLVVQSSFGAAPLAASLPVIMVTEPLASIVIGAVLFGERLRMGFSARFLESAGLVAMAVGVALVARSSTISRQPGATLSTESSIL